MCLCKVIVDVGLYSVVASLFFNVHDGTNKRQECCRARQGANCMLYQPVCG